MMHFHSAGYPMRLIQAESSIATCIVICALYSVQLLSPVVSLIALALHPPPAPTAAQAQHSFMQ